MKEPVKILMAFDGTDASWRALKYVSGIVCSGFEFCLFNCISGPPPDLREHRGSEDPEEERRLAEQLKRKAEEWIEAQRKRSEETLDEARNVLLHAGVSKDAIKNRVEFTFGEKNFASLCLDVARQESCSTVVVGRSFRSRLSELFTHHSSTNLLKRGRGLAFWVVE